MTNVARPIVLAAGLVLLAAAGAAAQTTQTPAEPKAYVEVNIAGQTQSVTLATSSTFSLFGETGATSSSSTVGKGLVIDVGGGYFIRKNLAVGLSLSSFNRSPIGSVSVTVPDAVVFGAFTTVSSSPTLTQSEMSAHLKIAYVVRITDKIGMVVSAGPSFVKLSKDIASATVSNGTAVIAVTTQTGTGPGVNAGADLQYFFTPRLGGGIFARYVAASVDLAAASGVPVGGFQGGLGLRVRF